MLQRAETIALAASHADGGLLCSESVLLAFSELLGVESELILRIATGLGADIGGRGSGAQAENSSPILKAVPRRSPVEPYSLLPGL